MTIDILYLPPNENVIPIHNSIKPDHRYLYAIPSFKCFDPLYPMQEDDVIITYKTLKYYLNQYGIEYKESFGSYLNGSYGKVFLLTKESYDFIRLAFSVNASHMWPFGNCNAYFIIRNIIWEHES